MVEQVTFQTVFQFLQTVGILVGVFYYIMTIRNNQRNQEIAQKNQELQLETRKAQLYMQLFLRITSEEFVKKSIDLLKFEYDNAGEFMEKYVEGPESSMQAKLFSMFWHLDGLGYMMSENLIDPEMVYNFGGGFAQVWHWEKWEPVVMEIRKRRGAEFMKWFEYTAEEMRKIRKERGQTPTVSAPSE
jgi:hypothetical protein